MQAAHQNPFPPCEPVEAPSELLRAAADRLEDAADLLGSRAASSHLLLASTLLARAIAPILAIFMLTADEDGLELHARQLMSCLRTAIDEVARLARLTLEPIPPTMDKLEPMRARLQQWASAAREAATFDSGMPSAMVTG